MSSRGIATGSVITIVALAACSSFGDANDPDASETDGGPTVDGGTADSADGGSDVTESDAEGNVPFCQRTVNKAFKVCDDFEDSLLLNPPWEPNVELQTFNPTIVQLVEPGDDGFVRVSVPGADTISAAFLRHDIGTPSKPEVKLGLTLQVSGFSANDYVEIATLYRTDGPTAGIALDQGVLKLVASGKLTPISGSATARRRIVLTGDASSLVARDVLGNKLAELKFDAGTVVFTDLRVAIGVYYTPKCAAGTIDIDDVVIDY